MIDSIHSQINSSSCSNHYEKKIIPLLKSNFLGEFVTNAEKEKVRLHLGLSDYIFKDKLLNDGKHPIPNHEDVETIYLAIVLLFSNTDLIEDINTLVSGIGSYVETVDYKVEKNTSNLLGLVETLLGNTYYNGSEFNFPESVNYITGGLLYELNISVSNLRDALNTAQLELSQRIDLNAENIAGIGDIANILQTLSQTLQDVETLRNSVDNIETTVLNVVNTYVESRVDEVVAEKTDGIENTIEANVEAKFGQYTLNLAESILDLSDNLDSVNSRLTDASAALEAIREIFLNTDVEDFKNKLDQAIAVTDTIDSATEDIERTKDNAIEAINAKGDEIIQDINSRAVPRIVPVEKSDWESIEKEEGVYYFIYEDE